jgi:pre-mRNA branch site protein p14
MATNMVGGFPVVLNPEVNRILLVSNLPSVITGPDLYNIFGEFGTLRQVRIGTSPETKGTAFVVFDDIYNAKTACEQLSGFRLTKSKYLQVIYYSEERHAKHLEKKRKRNQALAEFSAKQEMDAQRSVAQPPAEGRNV